MTTAARGPVHLQEMRQGNLGRVLRALAERPGSRTDLAHRTGLTKATVASLVEPLLAGEVLAEDAATIAGRGRPSRPLRFHPRSPVAIGAEINVDYVVVTALTLDGRAELTRRRDLDCRSHSAKRLVGELAKLTRALRSECDRPVLGVGLAVPGIVSASRVVRAPNLPQLVGSAPGELLAEVLGVGDVPVDNEANLAARAHLWPHRDAGPDFVYISGEVGVGAGLVMNGELYRGPTGFAGEFGHLAIERAGRACGCGGQGCLEQYAGLAAILRASGRRRLGALMRALRDGEQAALVATSDAGRALGVGLASLLNIIDTPVVVLGGIYATLFEHLQPHIAAELDRRVLAAEQRSTRVVASALGREAAVRGAAGVVTYRACTEPAALFGGHPTRL